MLEFFQKYYVFTIIAAILTGALFVFRNNTDIVNIIIGCFIGLIAAPKNNKTE